MLELTGVLQVRRDAGRPESVLSDGGIDARGACAPLDHAVSVLLPHALLPAGLPSGGAEQRAVGIAGQACCRDVIVEILLQLVVTRNFMLLATFFVQPDPAAAPLHEIVTHAHLEHGVHARKGIGHYSDERAIAQDG